MISATDLKVPFVLRMLAVGMLLADAICPAFAAVPSPVLELVPAKLASSRVSTITARVFALL